MLYTKILKDDLNNSAFWNRFVGNIIKKLNQLDSFDHKILVVKLQDITREDNEIIPKIEYHDNI